MICPKCQKDIPDGFYLCPKCGYEVQVVPDYDIESDDLFHIYTTNTDEEPSPENDNKHKKNRISGTIPRYVYYILGVLAAVVAVTAGVFAVIRANRTLTADDYYDLAMESYEDGDFLTAEYYLKSALQCEDADTTFLEINLVRVQYRNEEYDALLPLCLKMISEHSTYDTEAYSYVIAVYLKRGAYASLAELLYNCEYEEIRSQYQEYMTEDPVFSLKSGNYEDVQILELSASQSQTIYYSLNDRDPVLYGSIYSGPIFLERGEYDVIAVCVNSYGVEGNSVLKSYYINTILPDSPYVYLEDGYYTQAKLITAESFDGYPIYYTTDGTEPTRDSTLYTSALPIPVGSSVFTFAEINDFGDVGETVTRNYTFEAVNGLTLDEASDFLYEYMIKDGVIIDMAGHIKDDDGKYQYTGNCGVPVGDQSYYVFYEYYLDKARNPSATGVMYGVNIFTGECGILKASSVDAFTFTAFE